MFRLARYVVDVVTSCSQGEVKMLLFRAHDAQPEGDEDRARTYRWVFGQQRVGTPDRRHVREQANPPSTDYQRVSELLRPRTGAQSPSRDD